MGEKRFLAGDIGIRTADAFHPILPRGTRLPRRASVTLRTDEDDQATLEFTILQRLGPAFSAAFRQTRIDGLPPRPRGKVKIRLTLEVSAEGELIALLRRPGKKKATEIARGRAEIATRDGLDRAARGTAGIGLMELGHIPPGRIDTPDTPVGHVCEACGHQFTLRPISVVSPATEGLTCEDCGNVLLIPALDNMAASFFRTVPGGRLGLAVAAAAVEPDRISAHGRALRQLANALRACSCGGRFDAFAAVRCPDCDTDVVSYANDPLFVARQTHLPLVDGARVVKRDGPRLWTSEHLDSYERDIRPGSLEHEGDRLVLPLRFRNRGGWLVIPLQYALVLRDAAGGETPAFRPASTDGVEMTSPEQWQATQDEADEVFAAEVARELGFRPLLGRVEPDEEVSGKVVFPVHGEIRGPLLLVVAKTLELPLA